MQCRQQDWDPADAVCAQGKSRAELEQLLAPSDLAHDKQRANIGEAAAYGIYFDDTEYDYMQHLKTVGVQEDGVDSIWLEAPSKSKGKGKAKDDRDWTQVFCEDVVEKL